MAENKQYNKDPKSSGNKDSNKLKPKFNVYWIYGAIAIVFLGLQFFVYRQKLKKLLCRILSEICLGMATLQKLL